jgi:hypothetical protein
MKRRRLLLVAAATVILLLVIAGTVLFRERVQRRRVFRPAGSEVATKAPAVGVPPVAQWTETFASLGPRELNDLLDQIQAKHPDLYKKYSLAYLHARALADEDDDAAAAKLAPFLEKGHPFRSLALYHRASIEDGPAASRDRTTLILEYPDSIYRDEAVDEELEYLASLDDPKPLVDFAAKIAATSSSERRREMSARIVEALVEAEGGHQRRRGRSRDARAGSSGGSAALERGAVGAVRRDVPAASPLRSRRGAAADGHRQDAEDRAEACREEAGYKGRRETYREEAGREDV